MDMDVDMDLDLAVDAPIDTIASEPAPTAFTQPISNEAPQAQINPFDGSVTGAADIAFDKVHIRGLDTLDQRQLKEYISTHFDSPHFQRIEWIDDTSANFIYDTASAASEALVAFTNTDVVDVAQLDSLTLRPARGVTVTKENGETHIFELQVRQATTSDAKKRGAHEASRFYMMNPDKDPREQRFKDKRDRIRGNVENGDYRRLRYDDREQKRRRHEDAFDESMYDEDGGAQSAEDDRRKRVRFGRRKQEDLFAGRETGRLRDRSASPMRGDGDGRYGFGSDPEVPVTSSRRRVRQRSETPPRRGNAGKELFGSRSGGSDYPAASVELFPSKMTSSVTLSSDQAGPKELFPNKKRLSHHRRSGAIDASPERILSYGNASAERPRSLADRITGGPAVSSGRSLADRITRDGASRSLADRITRGEEGISIKGNSGLSIKGAAGNQDAGLSIKGAASGVKELFPVKTAGGNTGKELFGEKLKGRGVARRTAASYY